ncbi:MAG: anthranilate phosphoribosyltransferase, partial [Rhodocyclaceae bacterium]|nr:anthranilate phosphoribosyltransferase [Rhodocyclaceae bacterium]
DGLDEISITGHTQVGELKDGEVSEYSVHPEQFNLPIHDGTALRAASVEASRDMVLGALEGKLPAARDIVALNAGASLYVSGRADSMAGGVEQALELIASGAARARLAEFVAATQKLAG